MKKTAIIFGLYFIATPCAYGINCPSAKDVANAIQDTLTSEQAYKVAEKLGLPRGSTPGTTMATYWPQSGLSSLLISSGLTLREAGISCNYYVETDYIYSITMNK